MLEALAISARRRPVVSSAASRLYDVIVLRVLPAALFGIFTYAKLGLVTKALTTVVELHGASFLQWTRLVDQFLGLLYFGLLAVLWVVRLPRRGGRRGLGTFALAMFSSFAIMFVSALPDRQSRPGAELVSAVFIGAGLAYSLWALTYLRRSFSIMPEARRLVTGGPYGLSRHPLYLGEAAAALGSLIAVAGPIAIVISIANLSAQLVRVHWEERVLTAEFPEYREYARAVPRYLPFLQRP